MDERQQVTIIARAIQTLEWLRDNPGSLRDETSIGSCMAAESWRELRELDAALIVAAVNALAPLLDAHEALQRRVAELEGDR